MKKAIIYGFGFRGKTAYAALKDTYDILFFVDKEKFGQNYEGVAVYEPKELLKYQDVKVIVATKWEYQLEIVEDIRKLGIGNLDIEFYGGSIDSDKSGKLVDELNARTIDLGKFLYTQGKQFSLKELTFISGGSSLLDYLFLKVIAQVSKAKEYLEIGTYIGESINILTDCCEKLYSVTADIDSEYSMGIYCKEYKIPDFSERLTYNEKIIHYYGDSKRFDFSKHGDTVDLYFIDGDHSYNGVYSDTKNVFRSKKDSAIVIWHDFKDELGRYKMDIVQAVSDALGEEFKNVYVTNNNICGIYIPMGRKHEFDFTMRIPGYEKNAPLYTYDIEIKNCQIKL